MEVKVNATSTGFQPVKVELILQTREELALLYHLAGWNGSIAAIVCANGANYDQIDAHKHSEKYKAVDNFLMVIRDTLEEVAYENNATSF